MTCQRNHNADEGMVTEMNKPIIQITNGVTRHPEKRMAEPVCLTINRGEQLAIVGDNASGKSRLVDIITGRYPLLQNETSCDFSRIKYITFRDSYGTADGNYYYQQRWNQHDIADDMPTVGDLLKNAAASYSSSTGSMGHLGFIEQSLIPLFDKPIITLSSGEMRRFQLARAMLSCPQVLIIDNPFIGLDAPTREMLARLLQALAERDELTLILVVSKAEDIPPFITHILPVAELRMGEKTTRENYMTQCQVSSATLVSQETEKSEQSSVITEEQPPTVVDFRNVSIRYGNRTILKELNWTVRQGEHWALSGANGSGKSTLLSLVCADNPQSYACDVSLFGHRRGTGESIWDIKRRIGYVSPEMHRAYIKDIPAIDIVASGLSDSIGLYFRPRPEQKECCVHWMQIFGISHLADRTFLQLSSGEQRLCLLARAFVKNPDLLILDEPLHGLDARNCTLVKQIIEDYCRTSDKTLIMVTHYEEELPPCIDHRLYLEKN